MLAASLTRTYHVANLSIPVSDILAELAAAFIGLTVLVGIYKLVGEEDTIALLRQLLAMNRSAAELAKLGIERVIRSRTEMEIYEVHDHMRHSKEVFIASRHFNAIKYSQVQILFEEMLARPGTRIRILVTHKTEARVRLCAFLAQLPQGYNSRCMVRTTESLSVGIYGWDHGASIILYTNLLPGSECPVLQCVPMPDNNRSLYSLYCKEFDTLWETAIPISAA
jgi:hypothetical protein